MKRQDPEHRNRPPLTPSRPSVHHLWTSPALQELFGTLRHRESVAAIYSACCAAGRLLALMRSADRHPITLSSSSARCCTRVLPTPVRPVMSSRRQVPSQTEGERGGRGQGANRAELLILFFLLITSLFDRRDHLFVPTCLVSERRAQRTARLARQGHRRRRPGLAGASTVLSCRGSGLRAGVLGSSSLHPCASSAAASGLR